MGFENSKKESHVFGSSGNTTSFKDIKSSTPVWLVDEEQSPINLTSHEENERFSNEANSTLIQNQDDPVILI
jgi:hypothetical protein